MFKINFVFVIVLSLLINSYSQADFFYNYSRDDFSEKSIQMLEEIDLLENEIGQNNSKLFLIQAYLADESNKEKREVLEKLQRDQDLMFELSLLSTGILAIYFIDGIPNKEKVSNLNSKVSTESFKKSLLHNSAKLMKKTLKFSGLVTGLAASGVVLYWNLKNSSKVEYFKYLNKLSPDEILAQKTIIELSNASLIKQIREKEIELMKERANFKKKV